MPLRSLTHEINIAPFLQDGPGAKDVLKLWRSSMENYGFVQITGHGVGESCVSQIQECARFFFAQPLEHKMRHCLGKGYGAGGYTPQAVETVAKSNNANLQDPPDLVENYVFLKPESLARRSTSQSNEFDIHELERRAEKYRCEMHKLLQAVMQMTAMSLGLPRLHFSSFFRKPENHLRLASYPVVPCRDRKPLQFGYGAHTDYTGFTILKQDDNYPAALQVFVRDEWFWVPPKPNAFLINAGDLIEIWTNGTFKSPLHRVVMPDVPASSIRMVPRLSVVYFTGPSGDSLIEPIKDLGPKCGGSRYEPVLALEHLRRKLINSNK